ncbi:MAG: DUF116 domain-containing protein [bacterium]
MSHFKEYQNDATAQDGRNLGDEWVDWNGGNDSPINEGKGLFLWLSAAVLILSTAFAAAFVYLVTPRLALWDSHLPVIAWMLALILVAAAALWFVQLVFTAALSRRPLLAPASIKPLFNLTFSGTFRVGSLLGISRDRVGHSFVRVSNELSRAAKPATRDEKLLLLLPRCLAKEELLKINGLKERYPITVHTVSGGELARKKVKELKPTAVIGVACERDLVSGIRDVGARFSVIGIPNQRPNGPCKETRIDMQELISAIEFFVGPASKSI